MKKKSKIAGWLLLTGLFILASFRNNSPEEDYRKAYDNRLKELTEKQASLLAQIEASDFSKESIDIIRNQINAVRVALKKTDFWLRYLEPVAYKKINGPLPVEWETEVFEKFEKPYRREGSGLSLALLYLDEKDIRKDSLKNFILSALSAAKACDADSVTRELSSFHHFYLCNRLFLLNLASIYTTGFECPDPVRVIPELRLMLGDVQEIYTSFNRTYPATPLPEAYLALYRHAISFVNTQPDDHTLFDHFSFLKDFVNPLFALNQQYIRQYRVSSGSYLDYSLNNSSNSIFSKSLYHGQNAKGIYLRVTDTAVLNDIEQTGKLLFYDPLLSGNNSRSCVSCHKPDQCYSDTSAQTSLQFDRLQRLPRNSPSLVNAAYNHLLMADGKHLTLQEQAQAVITNTAELGCSEKEILKKVLSCADYKKAFTRYLKYTPQEETVILEHITSAITLYYNRFSSYYSPFDRAMNNQEALGADARKGFNIFMGKAQCGTCHFVPQFNGVKPPYTNSEFEVLGVPKDTLYKGLSADKGRYNINPAPETMNAFRTGTLRNIERTKPYMHNGVFRTLSEVVDFYDAGGGAGRGLKVDNQTLSADSLHLLPPEKKYLLAFLRSLNETITPEETPAALPLSKIKTLNARKPGGDY